MRGQKNQRELSHTAPNTAAQPSAVHPGNDAAAATPRAPTTKTPSARFFTSTRSPCWMAPVAIGRLRKDSSPLAASLRSVSTSFSSS